MSLLTLQVQSDWIDYNDHMGDFAYAIVFSKGLIHYLSDIGFGPRYRDQHDATFYAVDKRIRFLRECRLGEDLRVETRLVGLGGKRISVLQVITAANGEDVAYCGFVLLFVQQGPQGPKTIEIPADMRANLARDFDPDYRPDFQAAMAAPVVLR